MKLISLIFSAILSLTVALTGCGSDPNKIAKDWGNIQTAEYSQSVEKLSHDRYNVIATVNSPVSKDDMENIAKKVVANTLKDHPDTHGIYINITDAPKGISYTLNGYEYGQNGSAGYDPKSESDKERSLKLVRSTSSKDWGKRPSIREYNLYKRFMQYLSKHPGTSEQDFITRYPESKITSDDLKAIEDKVNQWLL